MDESILIQPEFQRMDISNNGRMETNGMVQHCNINNSGASSHRRRRNSANSRQECIPCTHRQNQRDSDRYVEFISFLINYKYLKYVY